MATSITLTTNSSTSEYTLATGGRGPAGATGPAVTTDATIIDGSTNAVAGNAVFDALALKAPLISPSFTTPTLGAATATTINKVTITQPATGATLTIADGISIVAGANIEIGTSGYIESQAYIYTGTGGYIQTGTGGYISTAAGGSIATGTGNLTGPNTSGTIALTSDLPTGNATHTGDATGATALTLATVNSNVGSFTNASLTVNAKGLVTAASSGTAPVTSVTGTANQITVTGTTTPTLSLPATITGLTSVTSTTFVGALTGNATTSSSTTGNAATVTTNANLTGHITSVGNAAVLGSFTVAQLNTAVSDADVAKVDAQIHTGAHVFDSTTRPTSAATTGTLAAANASSLITKGDGDARYGPDYFQLITTPVEAYSTAYVNGPSLVVPAGSYDFEMFVLIQSVGETAGSQSNVACSPTTDISVFQDSRVNNLGALGTGGTPTVSFRKQTNAIGAADFISSYCDAPNNFGTSHCRGTTVLASETTINLRIKQRGAGDAVNPAQIAVGSFMKFTKR